MIPISMVTIYDHPPEFPDHYVVRDVVLVVEGGRALFDFSGAWQAFVAIEDAREHLRARGLLPVSRSPGDDPFIMESWL